LEYLWRKGILLPIQRSPLWWNPCPSFLFVNALPQKK